MEILKLKNIKFEIKFTRQAYEQYNGSRNLKTSIETIQSEKQREKKVLQVCEKNFRVLWEDIKHFNTYVIRFLEEEERENKRKKSIGKKKDEKFPIFFGKCHVIDPSSQQNPCKMSTKKITSRHSLAKFLKTKIKEKARKVVREKKHHTRQQ